MKIQTSRFGEMDVEEQSVISIPGGLIGFPEQERFVIIRHNPQSPFFWLQALDQPDLAFVIVDPLVFKPDYRLDLAPGILALLGADKTEDVGLYVIVTIPPGRPESMTANLLGPLAVNVEAKLARQLVLDESRYSHQHPIIAGGGAEGGADG